LEKAKSSKYTFLHAELQFFQKVIIRGRLPFKYSAEWTLQTATDEFGGII
jgi:hypothetical protein